MKKLVLIILLGAAVMTGCGTEKKVVPTNRITADENIIEETILEENILEENTIEEDYGKEIANMAREDNYRMSKEYYEELYWNTRTNKF